MQGAISGTQPPGPCTLYTPHPPTPQPQKSPLTAAASEQGAVGCKRERERPVSWGVAGRPAARGERGEVGGWQLGLSGRPGPRGFHSLGPGFSLRQGQRRGEAGSPSPAEAPAGPGVCRVAGAQLLTPETALCGVWSGRRPVATCVLSFIHSGDPASLEAHLCQAWSLALELTGHSWKPLENSVHLY